MAESTFEQPNNDKEVALVDLTALAESLPENDPLRDYLKEIGKIPKLSPAEELALVRASAADPLSKNKLLEANLHLVVSIASRYTEKGMTLIDLIQEGNIGLIKAVDTFDISAGIPFSVHAVRHIEQQLSRSIADQARTIRIPIHMMEAVKDVTRVSRQLLQQQGYEPSPEEIAAEMGISAEKVREILKTVREPAGEESPICVADDSPSGDFTPVEGPRIPVPPISSLSGEQLEDVLSTLSPREQQVLKLRFGIEDGQRHSLEEVSREYALTAERIRQIEAKALRKLRHPSRSKTMKDFLDSPAAAVPRPSASPRPAPQACPRPAPQACPRPAPQAPVRRPPVSPSAPVSSSVAAAPAPVKKGGLFSGLFGKREKAAAPKTAAPVTADDVQFRGVAPAAITSGEYFIVKIMMYREGDHGRADRESSAVAKEVKTTSSSVFQAERGQAFRLSLQSPDVAIEDSSAWLHWNGTYAAADFEVLLPETYDKTQVRLHGRVYSGDAVLTDLKLIVQVNAPQMQDIPCEKLRFRSAFISYASTDRPLVAARIQGIQLACPDMDLFFDAESLRRGERWEPRIYHEISTRDLFYLFWSSNAAKSEWVTKELEYALSNKDARAIEPIPLESPEVCPPPPALQDRHFNDWTLRYFNR